MSPIGDVVVLTMSEEKNYICLDGNGVYRVGMTRVMLDSVVAAFRQGHSAETIKQQYPALSLEEVYGSIAYYLAHAAEIDAYLHRQDTVWGEWLARSEQQPSPVVERLRALAKAGTPETRSAVRAFSPITISTSTLSTGSNGGTRHRRSSGLVTWG